MLSQAQHARYRTGDSPLMITEFGGISHASGDDTWGYSTVHSDEECAALLGEVFGALRDCPGVVGYCYTQLLDTLHETNGLLTIDRKPKLPLDVIRGIVTGQSQPVGAPTSTMGWRANPSTADEDPSSSIGTDPEEGD